MTERRKRLIPAFRKSRKDSTIRSSLIAYKLYINGRQLTEDEAIAYADDSTPGHSQHPGNSFHRTSPVNRQQNASRLCPNRVTNVTIRAIHTRKHQHRTASPHSTIAATNTQALRVYSDRTHQRQFDGVKHDTTHVSQSEHSDRPRHSAATAACVGIRSTIERC